MGGRVILRPSARLGAPQPWTEGEDEVVERVRLVLETRPGRLPWRPEFGCNLDEFVGQPATAARLREIQWRVEAALCRWIPGLRVDRCEVRVAPSEPMSSGAVAGAVPLAEASLLSLGSQADLELQLDLLTAEGSVSLQATLAP